MSKDISKTKKKRIFDIISIGQREDAISRGFDYLLVVVIIINIAVMFMETFDKFNSYGAIFGIIEIVCMIFFCGEYVLRIWTADLLYPDLSKAKAIKKFLISYDGVVDLLTILPFFFLTGFVVFRMLRVVRIFHLFRINASYDSFNVITTVIYEKKNQILSSIFILFILMAASSLCMYSAEHDAQPEAFNNAFSGLWWSISTILTVGYGDIYPITTIGRMLAIVIAILGVGVVAIPTGIISAGFVEQYTKMQTYSGAKGTVSINVDLESPFIGLSIKELGDDFGIEPLVIIRDGMVVIPTDDIKIVNGDTLVYHTDDLTV